MRKEQLFQFIEVVDCGSINKAAEKLFCVENDRYET